MIFYEFWMKIYFLEFWETEIQYLGPLQSSFLTLTMKTHFIAHFQCKCSFPTARSRLNILKKYPLDFLPLKSITNKIRPHIRHTVH